MDIWLFLPLSIVTSAALNIMDKCFIEHLFLILWVTYLRVELLVHMEILCLAYWLFFTATSSFYIPPEMYKGLNFSASLPPVSTFDLQNEFYCNSGGKYLNYLGFIYLMRPF